MHTRHVPVMLLTHTWCLKANPEGASSSGITSYSECALPIGEDKQAFRALTSLGMNEQLLVNLSTSLKVSSYAEQHHIQLVIVHFY